MALNVIKSEDVMINDILRLSFFENENEKIRKQAAAKMQALEVKLLKAQNFECTCGNLDQITLMGDLY